MNRNTKPPILEGRRRAAADAPGATARRRRHQGNSEGEGKAGSTKTADRFAVLNAFVDFTHGRAIEGRSAGWLVLFRDTKPDGTARTGASDLPRRAGVNVRTVKRAVGRLRTPGLADRWCIGAASPGAVDDIG